MGTYLILHGGAGPQSVAAFAELLSEKDTVLAPAHPGFNGTPRPEGMDTMHDLAVHYATLLREQKLDDVTVVGNSIGGWIAAELALLHDPRVTKLVLVDAAGLRVDAEPAADFFSMTMDQVAELSYYEPDKFRIDLSTFSDQQKAGMAGNRAALQAYAGSAMADPTLLGRLPGVDVPTLVVWGEADRMIPVANGKAYAEAIPGARLELIPDAGHLPQLETPQKLLDLVRGF